MARTKYVMEHDWTGEVSRMVQPEVMDAARTVRAYAAADDPRGQYDVAPATVTAGWDNEVRAGAAVNETRVGDGPRKRTLARAAEEAR